MEIMIHHLGQGLALILMLSLPAVVTAAFIGLVVGILQAVTQVQEQTIAAAPKITFVFLLIIFGGGLMMQLITEYLRESAHLAFEEIPRADTYILPPQSRDEREKRYRLFFKATGLSPSRKFSGSGQIPFKDDGTGTSHAYSSQQTLKPSHGIGEKIHLQKQSH